MTSAATWPPKPGLLDVCRRALRVFEDLGCQVDEAVPDYPPERIWSTVLTWRWWSVLKRHDLYADPITRAELKPEIIWEIEHGLRLSALDVARVEVARTEWYDAALRFLDTYDFVIAPSTQVFPFPLTTHWPGEIDGRPHGQLSPLDGDGGTLVDDRDARAGHAGRVRRPGPAGRYPTRRPAPGRHRGAAPGQSVRGADELGQRPPAAGRLTAGVNRPR